MKYLSKTEKLADCQQNCSNVISFETTRLSRKSKSTRSQTLSFCQQTFVLVTLHISRAYGAPTLLERCCPSFEPTYQPTIPDENGLFGGGGGGTANMDIRTERWCLWRQLI
jgi:hypothetical protein